MDFYYYLKFPFDDREGLKKLAIGSLILLAPIINILALGYLIECIKVGAYNRRTLPYWQDFEGLLQNGLIALLILTAYLLPALLLMPLFLVVPIIGVIMQTTILLIVGLLVPLAIGNYVITEEIKDAFKIGDLLGQLSQILSDYVIVYLMMIIVFSISVALIFTLPIFVIFAVIINFYLGVIVAYFIGQMLRITCHK